jgi:hypothetical protein
MAELNVNAYGSPEQTTARELGLGWSHVDEDWEIFTTVDVQPKLDFKHSIFCFL